MRKKINKNEVLTNESNAKNALNESSLLALFALYQISSLLPILLQKMSEYPNFNSFLQAASEADSDVFFPELKPNSK